MDDNTRTYYERKSKQYREELKTWEHNWLKDHGQKPSRSDIKNNPDIASKYKLFQKAQDILSGKVDPPPKESSRQHKRKSSEEPIPNETPLKRAKHTETPSNTRFQDQSAEETPTISRKLFTPSANTSLGPTPQRDGRVLGLFDLLEDGGLTAATPSRKHDGGVAETPSRMNATPSKSSSHFDVEVTPRMGRTPMSDSKRQYLNTFMSPLKNRDGNVGAQTPSRMHFETPKFLRRHTLATVDENGDFDKPAPLRLPRKPLGRGLSEIVASLRKDEEDKADEDLEALREIEAEELGQPIPKKATFKDIEVQDSQHQPQLPLGGFDDESMFDSVPDTEGKDTNGQPLRLYKKKGQKRTTRKVNIKPTWNKRPTVTAHDQDDSEDELVPKTQLHDADFDQDDNDISSASDGEGKKKAAKKRKSAAKEGKEGPVRKAARKVNELAHANFQKLKLKQGGAKGGPGYNSRFRRRR